MIQNTKCECGHQNHVGTVLCEACGKPLEDEGGDAPLEMRYDGVARRSQRANPDLLDRVWNFFSSVKIAIYLIIITLLGSALGTILPQENTFRNMDPSVYYEQIYGTFGQIYYTLGLTHTYSSWWFVALLFMIGTSLVVCSLDRVLPLYRALSKQQIRKHPSFILRQKIACEETLPDAASQTEADAEHWVSDMAGRLRGKHYKVHTEGTALLAEKYRFSRWGPYINHIGLIIFLAAVLLRGVPGWHMDGYISVPEGEIVKVPDTGYYMKNEKFTLEMYAENEMSEEFRKKGQAVPKKYATHAVLYECDANCDNPSAEPTLREVSRHNVEVNKPLDYKGFMLYQDSYLPEMKLVGLNAKLQNKQTGEVYGSFPLRTKNPAASYAAGGYRLRLVDYYPDFGGIENGRPFSKSQRPDNPVYFFEVTKPDGNRETVVYFAMPNDQSKAMQEQLNGRLGNGLDIGVGSMADVTLSQYTSVLNVRVDKAMPYIWVGAAISMIGLIMGFYWQHRRIWLRIDDGKVSLGAHTNKNWFGLRSEVASALAKTGVVVDAKTLERQVTGK